MKKIQADELRIRQVILNLLSNAAKFTKDGGDLGLDVSDIDSEKVKVKVWDNGIGIEEQHYDKVFSPFERIRTAFDRPYEGTGLGLSLAKKLVELHNEKIWFSSKGKDKGTQFYFTLSKN